VCNVADGFFCSGQPHLREQPAGIKHWVYTAFCASGVNLPPVIFVGSQKKREDWKDGWNRNRIGQEFYVSYVAENSAPSESWTLRWLDVLTGPGREYLTRGTHIILDSLAGHTTPAMLAEWDVHGIIPLRIPASAGKFLNPCDQAPHSVMRRKFNELQHLHPKSKIENIIEAYYSIDEMTILTAFEHAMVFNGNFEDRLAKHACQGFAPSPGHEEEADRLLTAFHEWCRVHTRKPADVLPRSVKVEDLGSKLDGRRNATFGRPPHK
jgi:hypothetical protein